MTSYVALRLKIGTKLQFMTFCVGHRGEIYAKCFRRNLANFIGMFLEWFTKND